MFNFLMTGKGVTLEAGSYPVAYLLTRGRVVCEDCYLKAKKKERIAIRKLLWYNEAVEEKCSICRNNLIRI